MIDADKKAYYNALAATNHTLEINAWLEYVGDLVLQAQQHSLAVINFTIAKARFYQKFQQQFNLRQAKVIARIFQEGIKGFEGGLSAKNYMIIADTTASTATRDLQQLVSMGALTKTGELKATRYFIQLAQLR